MMETTSAPKKYLSCICGSVKGKRSSETSDSLTITSPSNGASLRQHTRQSKPTSNAARTLPGFANEPGSFGSHWYRFGALRVNCGKSPACAGYVINNSVRGLPSNQEGKIEAAYVTGVMRK